MTEKRRNELLLDLVEEQYMRNPELIEQHEKYPLNVGARISAMIALNLLKVQGISAEFTILHSHIGGINNVATSWVTNNEEIQKWSLSEVKKVIDMQIAGTSVSM